MARPKGAESGREIARVWRHYIGIEKEEVRRREGRQKQWEWREERKSTWMRWKITVGGRKGENHIERWIIVCTQMTFITWGGFVWVCVCVWQKPGDIIVIFTQTESYEPYFWTSFCSSLLFYFLLLFIYFFICNSKELLFHKLVHGYAFSISKISIRLCAVSSGTKQH